jgi:hypothetical protein
MENGRKGPLFSKFSRIGLYAKSENFIFSSQYWGYSIP